MVNGDDFDQYRISAYRSDGTWRRSPVDVSDDQPAANEYRTYQKPTSLAGAYDHGKNLTPANGGSWQGSRA